MAQFKTITGSVLLVIPWLISRNYWRIHQGHCLPHGNVTLRTFQYSCRDDEEIERILCHRDVTVRLSVWAEMSDKRQRMLPEPM